MSDQNGESEYNKRLMANARVDELNALALAENLAELRTHYDQRLEALENEIETLKGIVQSQTQVIGQAIGQVWGSGRTEAGK